MNAHLLHAANEAAWYWDACLQPKADSVERKESMKEVSRWRHVMTYHLVYSGMTGDEAVYVIQLWIFG